MKKQLLTLLLMASYGWAGAQSLEAVNATIINDKVLSRSVTDSRSVTCDADSIFYGLSKATGLAALGINNATSASAVGQYFDCPQPITISGASFYGWKANATGGISINVTMAIYNAGADSLPTGAALATATIAVDTVFGDGSLSILERGATFASPVTVSQPYVMVMTNASANSVSSVMSSYAANDGLGEWLAMAKIGTQWLHGYEISIGANDFDADFMVQPVVSYDMDADFNLTGLTCVPSNGAATWTNTSSAVNFNRMYSIADFLGITEAQFSWDYGDASALDNVVDGAHTYSGMAPWNVTLTDSLFGWTSTCVDVETKSTADQVDADFTYASGSLTVLFGDLTVGPNIVAWEWDFGDGNTSTQQSPTHTYAANGDYNVCLTAYSDCNSDQHCILVNASVVTGIAESLENSLGIYPNPSDGNFTIELNGVEATITLEVTDMTGRSVHASVMQVNGSIRKNMDLDLSSGTYIVRLTTDNESVVKKVEVK